MFPIVLQGWEMHCFIFPLRDFDFSLAFLLGATSSSEQPLLFFFFFFGAFTKFYRWEMLPIHTKGHLFWGKQILLLSTVSVSHLYLSSYLSSLSSFCWPCKMAVVICSWVLVTKWRIHSVVTWRSLCWSADRVKLWQRSLQCAFPHCSARTVRTSSMCVSLDGLSGFLFIAPTVENILD